MGRKSSLTEKQWAQLSEDEWRKLASDFLNSKDDEACIVLLLRMNCIFGDIRRIFKTSKIDSFKFEYPVSGGRVDLVLFHSDGGVSLIEVKGANGSRDVVAGIGQLFLYEAMFSQSKPKAKAPAYIDKFLLAPITGKSADKVDRACALANVKFVQYAPLQLIGKFREECAKEWGSHGA
jgi:hypothetical protein